MECKEIKINLPEYIDGKLNETSSSVIKEHLEQCSSCNKTCTELKSFLQFTDSFPPIEPPKGMKEEFLEMADLDVKRTIRIIGISFWAKIAATILIILGTFITGYFAGTKRGEVMELQAELNNLKQQVLLAGLKDYSGPQKIDAVYNIKTSGVANETLVSALVYTMNGDENVNVRLAAINALSEMMDKNLNIKTELIRSLSIQDNPLLQISLIQVLTESGVKEAKDEIESIYKNENTDEYVKEYAKDMIKTII